MCKQGAAAACSSCRAAFFCCCCRKSERYTCYLSSSKALWSVASRVSPAISVLDAHRNFERQKNRNGETGHIAVNEPGERNLTTCTPKGTQTAAQQGRGARTASHCTRLQRDNLISPAAPGRKRIRAKEIDIVETICSLSGAHFPSDARRWSRVSLCPV